jgi:hypothetical protein
MVCLLSGQVVLAAREFPQFEPNEVLVHFKSDIPAEAIGHFFSQYGVITNYSAHTNNLTVGSVIVLERNAPGTKASWALVHVPLAHEQRWADIFAVSAFVKDADRVRFRRDRGSATMPTIVTQFNAKEINAAVVTPLRVTTPAVPDKLFEAIHSFLKSRFPKAQLWVEEKDSTLILRRRYYIHGIRGEVTSHPKQWEHLWLDAVFEVPDRGDKRINITIDGQYAPGVGSISPPLSEYESLIPRFNAEYGVFQSRFNSELQTYLTASVSH